MTVELAWNGNVLGRCPPQFLIYDDYYLDQARSISNLMATSRAILSFYFFLFFPLAILFLYMGQCEKLYILLLNRPCVAILERGNLSRFIRYFLINSCQKRKIERCKLRQ